MSQQRVLEEISGTGTVFSNGKELGQCGYSIIIKQDLLQAGEDILTGLKEITGKLIVADGTYVLELGQICELVLEDGRRWEFWPKSGDPVRNVYDCVNSGSEGIH